MRTMKMANEKLMCRSVLAVGCLVSGLAVATDAATPLSAKIVCEGTYPYHLQGVATDGAHLYWSFTTVLVKTDLTGKALATDAREGGHMGDLCCSDGKVYVGINRGGGWGRVGDEVWQYDAATLKLERKIPTPQAVFCNNGVEWCDGFFYVIGSTPDHSAYNVVHVYTKDWKYRGCRFIDSGWTLWGVQTIARIGERLVFGYYGDMKDARMPHPSGVFAVDPKALAFGRAHAEHAEVVPILGRRAGGYGEGIVELGGRAWRAGSRAQPAPEGSPTKSVYTATLIPAPELEATSWKK